MQPLIIFAELARQSILQGQSRQYWAWTVLRALDKDGHGWVAKEQAFASWPQSASNLRAILSSGEGDWWTTTPDRVYYVSAYRAGYLLETTLGNPIYAEFSKCNTIGKFRAQCYAAFFARPRMIGRARLQGLFGVSEQTLRNWERRAGISRSANIVKCIPPADGTGVPDGRAGGVWFSGGYMYYQAVNTYQSRQEYAPRHSRDNKLLRHTLKLVMGKGQRLYFDDAGKASRAVQGGQEYVCLRTGDRWHGATEWVQVA